MQERGISLADIQREATGEANRFLAGALASACLLRSHSLADQTTRCYRFSDISRRILYIRKRETYAASMFPECPLKLHQDLIEIIDT